MAVAEYKDMINNCKKWFPILDQARYVKSLYVVLPIDQRHLGTDGRPTDFEYHNFGCYSILGGKIITCVSTAKKIDHHIQEIINAS